MTVSVTVSAPPSRSGSPTKNAMDPRRWRSTFRSASPNYSELSSTFSVAIPDVERPPHTPPTALAHDADKETCKNVVLLPHHITAAASREFQREAQQRDPAAPQTTQALLDRRAADLRRRQHK
ncbi:Aste57867_19301 [Aphanomyces stellatus]|uniref:Aste57867_19301 protein n=1 Tax=Aphanomyces stellatus TaxID=120398 RepID=A0A485LD11_9STRA|nr:hypothetical protein As57867_019237 [Aphanomyces stellatus]VFT96020.1 Aste57867_19301 [Aphanomyces stellatus]